MQKDVYQDIEEALLSQDFFKNEGEFSPDTEVFQFVDTKKHTNNNKSGELLEGSTTMYMDAIKALDEADKTNQSIGKLDNMKDMSTTDFLGETDFLGYTDYLEGNRPLRGAKEEGSYEVVGDENDNPFRNVFGFGPKKKPAKTSGKNGRKAVSNSKKAVSKGAHAATSAAKGAVKGTEKTVSAGKKAAMGVVHTIQLIIRLFCFILMLACGYQIAGICYTHMNDLGEIAYMIPYKNYAQFIYIFLAALTVLYAAISALSILAARRRIVKGKAVNGDYGQGLFPFIFFILLAICSGIIPNYLPYTQEMQGVILFLNMIQVKSGFLIKVNAIGALLCLARKLTHSL